MNRRSEHPDVVAKRKAADKARREMLKDKDAGRKRLIAAGLMLGYSDQRIADAIGITLHALRDSYGDLLQGGRDGQAMALVATMAKSARKGDTQAAIALMRAMEPTMFHPPKAGDDAPQTPITLNLNYGTVPAPVTVLPSPEAPQRVGITIDGNSVRVNG